MEFLVFSQQIKPHGMTWIQELNMCRGSVVIAQLCVMQESVEVQRDVGKKQTQQSFHLVLVLK